MPTPRKIQNPEILAELRARGYTSREIGEKLGVSEHTVRRHMPTHAKNPSRAADAEAIAELRKRGYTVRETAEALGITERTVSRRTPDHLKVKRATPRQWTDEMHAQAKLLLEDRAGYNETARTLGVDPARVARRFPGLGLTEDEVIERWIHQPRLERLAGVAK